jgi:hypothetical protein
MALRSMCELGSPGLTETTSNFGFTAGDWAWMLLRIKQAASEIEEGFIGLSLPAARKGVAA